MICRVFKKSSSGKKTPISSLFNELSSSMMPPLMDCPYNNMFRNASSESAHVSCFSSGSRDGQKFHGGDMIDSFLPSSSVLTTLANTSNANFSASLAPPSLYGFQENLHCPSSAWMQDHGVLRSFLRNHESTSMKQTCKPDQGELIAPSQDLAAGPLELDYMWNY